MPNWLRQKGILKAARTRAFEKVCAERGVTLTPEEALSSSDDVVVAAAAWVVPKKVLTAIVDGMKFDKHLALISTTRPIATKDGIDFVLFINRARGCCGCGTHPRRCLACENVLETYQCAKMAVPEHMSL